MALLVCTVLQLRRIIVCKVTPLDLSGLFDADRPAVTEPIPIHKEIFRIGYSTDLQH